MKDDKGQVIVDTVWRGSPAALGGLEVGDHLLRADESNVQSAKDVIAVVAAHVPGERLGLQVLRAEQHRLLSITLEPKPDTEALMRKLFVGEIAPPLDDLRAVQGNVTPSVASLRGKVWVLEFWASWCMACRALGPVLNQWKNDLEVLGVEFMGVTMDPYDQAAQSSREQPLEYATFVDESGEVSRRYHGMALPTLFVVDRDGIVRDVSVGYSTSRLTETRALLKQLALKPSPSAPSTTGQ